MERISRVCNLSPPLLLLPLLLSLGSATAQKGSNWKTLSGGAPVVIAKGGFSGAFPESSDIAYIFDGLASSWDTIIWYKRWVWHLSSKYK
ncbi:unnamed protein product [Urochloa humidicola]